MMFVEFANRSSHGLFGIWAAYLSTVAIILGALERIYKNTVLCENDGTVVVCSTPQHLVLGRGATMHNTSAGIHIHADILTQCGLPQSFWKTAVDNLHYVLSLTPNRLQYPLRYHWVPYIHPASYPDCRPKAAWFNCRPPTYPSKTRSNCSSIQGSERLGMKNIS